MATPGDRPLSAHWLWPLGLAIVPLVAFSDRAFNIDEPLFIWLAEHIARPATSPLDFFGFDINWYGSDQPMYAVTRNPPLMGYAIAGVASIVGWSERALHLAFAIPSAICVLVTFQLAERFTASRTAAAVAAALTVCAPVFLASANTLMSDVPMLALWLLALRVWIHGLDHDNAPSFWIAAVLIALAVWTKHFALALIPLLGAQALVSRVPLRRFVPPLLVPLVALGGLEWTMHAQYGVGAIEQAAAEALHLEGIERPAAVRQLFEGLAFAGGSIAPALFFAPWLWGPRVCGVGVVLAAVVLAFAPESLGWLGLPIAVATPEGTQALASMAGRSFALQFALMVAGGASVIGLAVAELRAGRDPDRLVLGLWILGTFVFAAFVNWTNNGRSNLPLAPVVGIAIVRRLLERGLHFERAIRGVPALAFGLSFALALSVAAADRSWSNGVREAAARLANDLGGDAKLWFHGHWGFQFYLERAGGHAVDWKRDAIAPGELLVVPTNNAEAHIPSERTAQRLAVATSSEGLWLRTQAKGRGASFNASNLGSAPFLIGDLGPDRYRVFRAKRLIRYERWFGWSHREAAQQRGKAN